MKFEVLEHTADIGLRAWGSDIRELFANAAEGLTAIVLETDAVSPREKYPIEARGEDREALLVNFLNEVLYLLDGRQIAFQRFSVEQISGDFISATGYGEPRSDAIPAKLIVKGVTWHLLRIAEEDGRCVAEVYLDI